MTKSGRLSYDEAGHDGGGRGEDAKLTTAFLNRLRRRANLERIEVTTRRFPLENLRYPTTHNNSTEPAQRIDTIHIVTSLLVRYCWSVSEVAWE